MVRFLALSLALASVSLSYSDKPDDRAFFEQRIWPILKNDCLKCHGDERVRNGLNVASRADLLKGGEHGPAIVPGEPEKSLFIQSVRYRGDYHMPPKEKLDEAKINDLIEWVKRGAPWPMK